MRLHRFVTLVLAAPLLVAMPTSAQPIDCGDQPTLKCLAPHVIALAKALPEGEFRRHMAQFADKFLMPGSPEVALRYMVDENPDPSEWSDIAWIAESGQFDRAIEIAETVPTAPDQSSAKRRLGGLVTVAWELVSAKQADRAMALLTRIEPELMRPIADDEGGYINAFAARTWAELGQMNRATRLLQRSSQPVTAMQAFLQISDRHPAFAPALRLDAWKMAERDKGAFAWLEIAKHAAKRNDTKTVQQAAHRALTKPFYDPARVGLETATALFAVGLREEAAKIVDQWRTWLSGKRPQELVHPIKDLAAILGPLGREEEIEEAVRMIPDAYNRSQALAYAADRLVQMGLARLAAKLDGDAMAAAASTWGISGTSGQRDSALHNLALHRARRGDVNGALSAVVRIRDSAKAREVSLYVVASAISAGHKAPAIPALERSHADARYEGNADRLLDVAARWLDLDRTDNARKALTEALDFRRESSSNRDIREFLRPAAQVMWRLERDMRAAQDALDPLANTPELRAFVEDSVLFEVLSTSPGEALRLASAIADPKRRFRALIGIASKLAEDSSKRH